MKQNSTDKPAVPNLREAESTSVEAPAAQPADEF